MDRKFRVNSKSNWSSLIYKTWWSLMLCCIFRFTPPPPTHTHIHTKQKGCWAFFCLCFLNYGTLKRQTQRGLLKGRDSQDNSQLCVGRSLVPQRCWIEYAYLWTGAGLEPGVMRNADWPKGFSGLLTDIWPEFLNGLADLIHIHITCIRILCPYNNHKVVLTEENRLITL